MDLTVSNELERALFEILKKEPGKHLLLNFEHLDYLHSSGVRMLISLQVKLNESGCHLALCNINEEVRKILEFVDIIDMIDIYNSEEEALNYYK